MSEFPALSQHSPSLDTVATVLATLQNEGKIDSKDKRWITTRLNEIYDHERGMKILELLITDDEAFYKLLLLGGVGAAAIGTALAMVLDTSDEDSVVPDGIIVAGLTIIPAGMTLTTFAALMLAPKRIFGDDGVQFEIEGEADIPFVGGGTRGSLKVG